MKNDLTRDEWLALAKYLHFVDWLFGSDVQTNNENLQSLISAKEKIFEVEDTLLGKED